MSKKKKSDLIKQPTRGRVALEVTGTAPLIQNKFAQKALDQMLRKHMGLSVHKEKKNPRQSIEDATIYNVDRRVSIPPVAFKAAMISASPGLKGLKKTHLRNQLFIVGQSVPITHEGDMVPRMDMVRVGMNAPDVRFRPMFQGWKARMIIEFDDVLDIATVVDLLGRAGSVGVGEWRPEKNGTFGTFAVTRNIDKPAEQAEVLEECSREIPSLIIPDWAMDAALEEVADIIKKVGAS